MTLTPAPVVFLPLAIVTIELTQREALLIRAVLGNTTPDAMVKSINGSYRIDNGNKNPKASRDEVNTLTCAFCRSFDSI